MIKKIITGLLLMVSLSLTLHAQDYTRPELSFKIYPGTITTLDGKLLNGYILNGNNIDNQKECIYYSDYRDERTRKRYKPTELKGFSVENQQYKSMSYSGTLKFGKAEQHFVYLSKPGAISTYIYYSPNAQMLWAKGDEEPVNPSSLALSFRKSILKLINDDAELAKKVDGKEKGYGILNMESIINEYNTHVELKKQ
ncbi:hypothetical protein [Pedobacter sp. Leaf176]|uniref:hypothetical protein n=1 Tax=Pedobacter sp. Leaf176 TaxID=1736286 RepID=UPI0006F865FC|nr:hypothetical protein [Pedobacter sp. Leaf176]KQR71145.1 hypothetical protein ASF92_07055 [Pedobacter sp. Leaf176]